MVQVLETNMIRYTFTIYLLVTTTTGPWLCYSVTSTDPEPGSFLVPALAEDVFQSYRPLECCHFLTLNKYSINPTNEDVANGPYQHEHPCPSKKPKNTPFYQMILNDRLLRGYQMGRSPGYANWVLQVERPNIPRPSLPSQRNDQLLLPFLSTADLLHFHHLLRC